MAKKVNFNPLSGKFDYTEDVSVYELLDGTNQPATGNKNIQSVFWNFENKVYYTILNVTNFVDPFMLVLDNKTININSTGFIPGSTGTFTDQNFQLFYTRPEFIADDDAPSFLKRLQGDSSSDANGIETVLNPTYFPNTPGYSNVDYLYWTHVDGCLLVQPADMYLDAAHVSYYNRQTNEPGCVIVSET